VHAWTGLFAGPLLLVLGLSGAALVFRAELDDVLTPPPRRAGGAASPSLDAVVRAALVPHPGAEPRVVRQRDTTRPYRVELVTGGRRLDVDVDPATLRVLASRAPERSVFAAVHSLHIGFHAGRAGALVVGLLGLWLVVEGVSGLALYGPAVTPPSGARHRGSRGLHRVLGVLSLAVGVLLGLTGALLAFGNALGAPDADASAVAGLNDVDALVARALTASPGARVLAVIAQPADVVRIDVRVATGEARTLRLDRGSGTVTASVTPAAPWDLLRRLHAGDFTGWPIRAVYAAVGLALAVLAMTGFVIAARLRARTS